MPGRPVFSEVVEPPFGCTLGDSGGGASWVRVTGELDLITAPRLAQILGQAARRARIVVVDLRGLTRVDRLGVGAIADASRMARRDGRRLVLVRGLAQVERLLALTGALDAVEIVDLNAGEPPILALLQTAGNDRVATRQRARAPRRVATLLGVGQLTRGIDSLIARGIGHDFIDG
jgi:anti-anti-sigma factor